MDTPENSAQVIDESNCQVPFAEHNTKRDSAIQDDNEIQNVTTHESSDNIFNVPLQTPREYENQLVINEDIATSDQINVSLLSMEPLIEAKGSGDTQSNQEGITLVQDNSSELETISIDSGSVEQLIATTLSEVISCENDTVTTACAIQSAPDNINNISDLSCSLVESCADASGDSEVSAPLKLEGNALDSNNSELDESLPSFIGEIDESVSLPPAEPLILEENSSSRSGPDEDKEIVSRKLVVNENIVDDIVNVKTNDKNITKDETIHEDSTVNITNTDDEKGSENVSNIDNKPLTENISLNEIVPEKVTLNEIELTEAPQTEIVTSESNIHYTILPPGENSVYQEDGTLVVEYPLDTTAISHNQTSDVNEFIETHKIGITESTVSGEHEVVQIVENLNEGNFIEMIETHEDGSLSTETVTPEDASEKKHSIENSTKEKKQVNSEAVQPKRKGRRPIEGIPPHMVGHPIDKPDQDAVNGKALKPRLGVKIPYRKLASQIVSTSELQNHIVERARLKEEARTESDKTNLFTKKLTHRLAQSLSGLTNRDSLERKGNKADNKKGAEDIHIIENILTAIPSRTNENSTEQPTNPIEFVEQIVNEDTGMLENVSEKLGEEEVTVSSCESIENAEIIFAGNMKNSTNIESNSDLIAILEGDGDESSPIAPMSVPNVVEIVDTSENASEIRAIEKEISLTEQKSSIPAVPQVKEKKFFKSRDSRIPDVSKDKTKESVTKVKPNLITEISKTKISSVKNEEAIKTNIFDIESTSVLKGAAKGAELKKVPLNDQEKASSDFKKKSTATVIEVEPQLKPAMVLKTYTRKRKSNDVSTPEPPKKPLIMPSSSTNQSDVKIDCVTPIPPNVYVTKSSRVIKRKVIWDPDEAMPSVRNQSKILSKIEATVKTATPPKITGSQKSTSVKTVEKKISEKEKHVDQSKITKLNEKKVVNTTLNENDDIVEKQTVKKPEKPELTKKSIVKNPIADKAIPQKKVIITSSMKISPGKSPKKSTKRLSEIDKLLMDEGAVNMLYDINNSDDQKRRVSGRSGNTPTDKAQTQKELLNRTQEIKNELTQGSSVITSTPKILRKKEGPPSVKKDKEAKELSTISRKMSKDSTKSSTHSAPPSPAEASRIIRRHSSSSFSSDDGLVQDESMDSTVEQVDEKQNKKKEISVEKSSTTLDENPQEEQNKGKITKKRAAPTQEGLPKKRLKKDEPVLPNGEPSKPTEIVIKSEPGIVTGALMTDPTKAFTVIKMNKHYCINLTYSGNESYLTVQLLKDLTVTLRELERTRNCSVVSINSQSSTFCLGIDYKQLVESDDELRSKKIKELSLGIREFLKCLLNFSKIIVAGVKGDCIGLGVTMLPLFDMVVATDTASFSTPYAKVGCPPEAGFLLSIPYHSNHALASELLYTAQKMNADEAQRRGLVTKLFWPEKFDSEFRALLSHISNLSKPALMVTKKQLRQAYNNTENEIINNSKLLMKFWGNEECQNNFSNYDALAFIDQ